MTGSLYGIRNVYKALAKDDEWFTLVRWVLFSLIAAEEFGVELAKLRKLVEVDLKELEGIRSGHQAHAHAFFGVIQARFYGENRTRYQ